MGRFLLLWRVNWDRWPVQDLSKHLEMNEKLWKVMDDLMKKGIVKDYGIFPEGESGFLIGEGDAITVFKNASMFVPYVSSEVHEIIPFEKQKEITRGILQAQIAAMKK